MTNPQDQQYRHRLRWPLMNRQGENCQILRSIGNRVHIRFEKDGYEATTDRRALARRKESKPDDPHSGN